MKRLLLIMVVLFLGCIGEKSVTELRYVCPTGEVVLKPENCPRVEAEKVEILRYVCWDGSVVDELGECPEGEKLGTTILEATTLELGTTSTVPETTTVEELGTTIPETTTSTIAIETTTVEELGTTTSTTTVEDCKYVGSKNSNKYHYPDCTYAKRIKEENLICFRDEKEAKANGYEPCGVCSPP